MRVVERRNRLEFFPRLEIALFAASDRDARRLESRRRRRSRSETIVTENVPSVNRLKILFKTSKEKGETKNGKVKKF